MIAKRVSAAVMMKRRGLLLLGLVLLGACSVHRAELHARELAQLTYKVSVRADKIQQQRMQLVRARQVLVNQMIRDAAVMEQDVAGQVQRWRLSGHPDLGQVFQDLHDGAQADLDRAHSRVQQSAAQAQFLQELRSQAGIRIGKVDATAMALAQLSEDGTLRDHLEFFVGFLRDAKAALDLLQADTLVVTTSLATATPGTLSPPPPMTPAPTGPIVE
jgi:hypothetical protein